MEQILRSKEMAEIILLPVRHHSPACAWHIRRMIRRLKPDAVLIEGPENAQSLIPVMTHEDTKAPFAVYCSYQDIKGEIGDKEGYYKCYYPFLDYSPELAALRECKTLGIESCFMDLPYREILAACEESRTKGSSGDRLLSGSQFWDRLCERTGLRSFEEFWEKYFEIRGLRMEDEKWFQMLLGYCRIIREDTPPEQIRSEGCEARVRFMAGKLLKKARELGENGRVLAVTGGFHTPGLEEYIRKSREERVSETEPAALTGKTSDRAASGLNGEEGVYLMPYSMEETDAWSGYASGMPFPGFYQKIWEKLEHIGPENGVYEEAVLDFLIETGREGRQREGVPTAYDEICALEQARGLAMLREKKEPGAWELKDAVLASFIKGECTLSTDRPLRILKKCMTGTRLGKLCDQAQVPPLIRDFERQCAGFGIRSRSALEAKRILTPFSNQKHRDESKFFNRLLFLGADFARKTRGPDLRLNRDRNMMRETWVYGWRPSTGAALMDVSVHGATIEEAAVSLARERLKQEQDAEKAALLLTSAFEMGLEREMEPVYETVSRIILEDTRFYAVAEALSRLRMLQELQGLYRVFLPFEKLIEGCYEKLVILLPSMTRIREEDLDMTMKALKLLYQTGGRPGCSREDYFDALGRMREDGDLHPGLEGCIHGILYGSGREEAGEAEQAARGYLSGTRDRLLKTALFFRGVFFTARDLVFAENGFIAMLDYFFGEVEDGEFMELLPQLRLAFGCFTPGELRRIGSLAAGLHGEKRLETGGQPVLPGVLSYGKELEEYVKTAMEEKQDEG